MSYRHVVADHVKVALTRVELDGKPSGVTQGLRGAALMHLQPRTPCTPRTSATPDAHTACLARATPAAAHPCAPAQNTVSPGNAGGHPEAGAGLAGGNGSTCTRQGARGINARSSVQAVVEAAAAARAHVGAAWQ